MKQIAFFPLSLFISLLFLVAGCGRKEGAVKTSAETYRLNFAVVTIKDAFWQEQGLNSLSSVGNSESKRKQVAAKILYAPETKNTEFFFRQSWYVKAGDKVSVDKEIKTTGKNPLLENNLATYPLSWKGSVGYSGPRKIFTGFEVFTDGKISYHLSGHKADESIPDQKKMILKQIGDADMTLRVVQGDTSIWTIISLSENSAKPAWKTTKKPENQN